MPTSRTGGAALLLVALVVVWRRKAIRLACRRTPATIISINSQGGQRVSVTSQVDHRVFVSFRFAEAETEAKQIETKLSAKGVRTFVSGKQIAGDSLQRVILGAFKSAEVIVILGTRTYGKETGGLFSTLQEMNLTIEDKKKMYLFKMCDRWEEIATRAAFSDKKYKEWKVGEPIPEGAIDEIMGLLSSV